MTIPATVPLASRWFGTGVPVFVCLEGLLLVKMLELVLELLLWLVLLGVERTGVELMFAEDWVIEVGAAAAGVEVVNIGEMVELLLIPGVAESGSITTVPIEVCVVVPPGE